MGTVGQGVHGALGTNPLREGGGVEGEGAYCVSATSIGKSQQNTGPLSIIPESVSQ